MKLKTIRVRRTRPSTLALALALMLTMLCVYMLSLPGGNRAQQASVQTAAQADVRMPGLEAVFQCAGRYDDALDAKIAAAKCAQSGGAGLILLQEEQYAVISHAGGEAGESAFVRKSDGLTLRLDGASDEIAAVSDAAAFLQALHTETASLANSLQRGDTNENSISLLMNIYRTRGERIQDGLIGIETGSVVVSTLLEYAERALMRIECCESQPTGAHLRHLHAAACADWVELLDTLRAMAV